MSKSRAAPGRPGLIHIYTGDGKGKTTSALGMAMRAVGGGLKVIMIQFLKTSNRYGELQGATKLKPGFEIVQMGPECVRLLKDPSADKKCIGCMECHVDPKNPRVSDLESARRALEFAEKCLTEDKYDLVILDEINYAIDFNLLPVEEVAAVLKRKRDSVEVVLTGRSAPPMLVELADYVTEMREIKHPWRVGTKARKGIEY
ncbi:MAG: cob(I)yrinic acid a,c-diamide adenosyltransferase [Candidatus Abyssobacteria bacterium SURF_17]|uniref:corrinoid adenosyltransferase n=1 Tax=Candidatus Abyssobacteria bacterium SURF_17 TaxID=2093361 RepID=A0A419F6D3_9BACT|nr:MAG: cob(I)yrinic acid a,c-diamide adenosyltransferase [Candidatus Abyssubacteria bacterium SURF_17]